MKEVSYVVVFPTIFSKNKIPQLISNIKKILKIRNQEFQSIKRDGDIILVNSGDPVFSSSAINLLFGIEKVAIARQVKNDFKTIVSEITSLGGNLLLKGEIFLVKVEGTSKGFFPKDIEIAATSSIIEKKSNLGAKPGTEENYDKLLYTYLTKNNAYICIFIDKGQGGISFNSQKQNTICSIYDEISAVSCFETIKQGFDSKIIICYRKKTELMNLVKTFNQIIPRLVKEKVAIDFFQIKVNPTGAKNYLVFINSVNEILINEAKSNKLSYVSLALSPLIFSQNFIDFSIKKVFQNNKLPIMPLNGVDFKLFEEAKEIGLEKQIPKMNRIIQMNSKETPKISIKAIKNAVDTKKTVDVVIGPNNVHDILDSLEENH
ncbi:MAG TPA: thiamine biosynthesis protein [Nitrosopumilaceae archaeon]|nr:thiamine biosynthesis protein [Nitrosopumilaceae archaeon]